MKKTLKISGIILLILIVVMILLPFLFRGKIIRNVKRQANKTINAKVDFKDYSVSLFYSFPNFNLKFKNLSIIKTDEFVNDTVAKIPLLNMSVSLKSVFRGSYEIKKIKIERPLLSFKVSKDGKSNWDIIKHLKSDIDTTEHLPKTDKKSNAFKHSSSQKIIINNGTIVYDNNKLDAHIILKNINNESKGNIFSDFTILKTETNVESIGFIYKGKKYFYNSPVNIKADFDADLKNLKFTFKDNTIQLKEMYLGVNGSFAIINNSRYNINLKLNAKETKFKNILSLVPYIYSKKFKDIDTKGNFTLNGFIKGIYSKDTKPCFGLNISVKDAMFKYSDMLKSINNISFNTKIINNGNRIDNTEININDFHFEMANNAIDAKLFIKTPVSDPQVEAQMNGKFDLSEIKHVYPLKNGKKLSGIINADNIYIKGSLSSIEKQQYENFKAAGKITVANLTCKSKKFPRGIVINKATLNFLPQYIELVNFDSKLGKNYLIAKGKIFNSLSYIFRKDKVLKGDIEFSSEFMNLNDFNFITNNISTVNKGDSIKNKTNKTPADSVTLYTFKVPSVFDFYISSTFEKLIYGNMEMTNVSGDIKIRDKQIIFKDLKMNMLEGQIIVNGSYNTKNRKNPCINFDLDINEFDIQKTFNTFNTVQKFVPVAEKIYGKFSAKMNLKTVLNKHTIPIPNTITATGLLSVKKIIIENSRIQNKFAEELKMDKFKKINLEKTDLSFNIADEKTCIRPFSFNFDNIKVNMQGYNKNQDINYKIKLEIPESEFKGKSKDVLNNLISQAGKDIKTDNTVKINSSLTGTVKNPILKMAL